MPRIIDPLSTLEISPPTIVPPSTTVVPTPQTIDPVSILALLPPIPDLVNTTMAPTPLIIDPASILALSHPTLDPVNIPAPTPQTIGLSRINLFSLPAGNHLITHQLIPLPSGPTINVLLNTKVME